MSQKQFSLYIDNIVARSYLRMGGLWKESNIPGKLFLVFNEQREGLTALKDKYGPIVKPSELEKP